MPWDLITQQLPVSLVTGGDSRTVATKINRPQLEDRLYSLPYQRVAGCTAGLNVDEYPAPRTTSPHKEHNGSATLGVLFPSSSPLKGADIRGPPCRSDLMSGKGKETETLSSWPGEPQLVSKRVQTLPVCCVLRPDERRLALWGRLLGVCLPHATGSARWLPHEA